MGYVLIRNAANGSRRASIYACYIIARDTKVRREVSCRVTSSNIDSNRTIGSPMILNILICPRLIALHNRLLLDDFSEIKIGTEDWESKHQEERETACGAVYRSGKQRCKDERRNLESCDETGMPIDSFRREAMLLEKSSLILESGFLQSQNFKKKNIEKNHRKIRNEKNRARLELNAQGLKNKKVSKEECGKQKPTRHSQSTEERIPFKEINPPSDGIEGAHFLGFPVLFLFHPTTFFSRGR